MRRGLEGAERLSCLSFVALIAVHHPPFHASSPPQACLVPPPRLRLRLEGAMQLCGSFRCADGF